ncbi:hypothetical protein H1230_29950 [Paenibacillus sp. 19GGS1-52]|uniref:hypothetical protein n=1 Tax=Paenibacillus sp. 19GGS1-52 TaxID=2758563 RepID=UPI001EFAF3FD|nr:hypothetical protein [Paenibacillus sp. 19GGS1-52]ULO07114.1 hypothetical protein H1230_29950 [Paenibacillus sp. 19GGS1-52]
MTGIASAVAHPIETVKGLGQAVAHPIETGKAIGGAISAEWSKNVTGDSADTRSRAKFFTESALTIGSFFVGAGELKAVATASKVEKTVEAATVTTDAAKVGSTASKVADIVPEIVTSAPRPGRLKLDLQHFASDAEGAGEASDIYKHQQYKQSLLKEDVLSNSDVIIKGEDLWDDKARGILTSDGNKIEDWAKMTSKQQYETPYGKGEVHFYQNQKTGGISPFDIKLKVSKPKNLRANENDLFWIIEQDVDFNIKGVR